MKIVMPIAGRGSRFKEAGFAEPKPLIKILGKTMVEWALECIDYKPEGLIFICLKDHIDRHHIDKHLRSLFSDRIAIVTTDGVTEGAACTVLLARDLIDNDEECIIYNSDQYFKAPLTEAIQNRREEVTGIIPVFQATHPKWSYARLGADGYVAEVAEKVPISTHATVGLYYFARGRDCVWAIDQMMVKDIRRNNEFYVCPIYNELIQRGDKIDILESEFMWGLGTPEDVEYFEKYYRQDS
ncbi:MAG: glycosyltransferase family 2 protein [Dehalococcoidia bacterium]